MRNPAFHHYLWRHESGTGIVKKLKQFITILFCAGLIVQNSGIFLVLASFSANENYIAKNLCENKNKPSMHCNGKCVLAKKLREEQKQQSPASGSQKISPLPQLFFAESSYQLTAGFSNLCKPFYKRYNDLQTVRIGHYIFHPPNA